MKKWGLQDTYGWRRSSESAAYAELGIISSGLLESSEEVTVVSGQIADERALRQTVIELSRVPGAVALYGDLASVATQRPRDGGCGAATLDGRYACLRSDGHRRGRIPAVSVRPFAV